MIGAKGSSWPSLISPVLRSSSRARNATACSTRESSSTSSSKTKRVRRARTARKRSRKSDTGGKRRPRCDERGRRRLGCEGSQRRLELRRVLRRERPGSDRRERCRAGSEEAIRLRGQPFFEPGCTRFYPPVLGEALRELGSRRVRVELVDVELVVLGKQQAPLQLEQGGHEDEKLTAELEIGLGQAAPGSLLDEGDDDVCDLDVGERQLLFQDEGQEQIERALEGLELEVEIANGGHGHARRC